MFIIDNPERHNPPSEEELQKMQGGQMINEQFNIQD